MVNHGPFNTLHLSYLYFFYLVTGHHVFDFRVFLSIYSLLSF
jgi:hypothetical protein